LAVAFGKWAEKIQTGQAVPPEVNGTLAAVPRSDDDPANKPS
jgi:hypothetical protein